MPPARLRWGMCLLIVVSACAATWPVLGNRFINWDDHDQITQNPDFNPVTASRMLAYWHGPYVGSLYPVSYNLFGLLAVVGRQRDGTIDPFVFHIASILQHAACALLIFAILRLLLRRAQASSPSPGNPGEGRGEGSLSTDLAALVGALLFAVHPVQIEAVAWVSGMNTQLFTLLSLLAIWQYLLGRQPDCSARSRAVLLTSATLAFLLALWSKPTTVVVPIIAWLLDRLLTRRPVHDIPILLIAWLLLAIPIVWITRMLQTGELITPTPLWSRPFVAADAIVFYLFKLIFPLHLLVDYGRTPQWVAATSWTWSLILIPIALAYACWRLRDRLPWLGIGLAVFVVALLPMLGLTPFDVQMISTVTDRYLYLAMLGPAIVLAFALASTRSRTVYALCAVAIVLMTVRSNLRARDWHDEFTLFLPELKLNPRSLAAHQVLGVTYAAQKKPELAAHHLQQAIEVKPDDPRSLYNFANLLLTYQNIDEAIPYYRRALEKFPDYPRIHSNLGLALMLAGQFDESESEFNAALKLSPAMPEAAKGLQQLAARRAGATTAPASAK